MAPGTSPYHTQFAIISKTGYEYIHIHVDTNSQLLRYFGAPVAGFNALSIYKQNPGGEVWLLGREGSRIFVWYQTRHLVRTWGGDVNIWDFNRRLGDSNNESEVPRDFDLNRHQSIRD